MGSELSVTAIPDIDGHKAIIQHIKMPLILSNRSIIQVYYLIEGEDGSLTYIVSSKGTEAAAEEHKGIIKKNVVANNVVNYHKLTPTEGGMQWESCQCLDVAGSIPDALKRKGAERQAKMPLNMIMLIKTGNVPT